MSIKTETTNGAHANRPIAVFDSGVGGLTVVRAIRHLLPRESIHYLGDTARVPYGTRSAGVIQTYAKRCADFLNRVPIKMLVVACNTASAHALAALRERSAVPVVGVISPGVDALLSGGGGKKLGVISTEATLRSGSYRKQIALREPDTDIVHVACPLFVPLAEEDWTEHEATKLIAHEYLEPLSTQGVERLLLGCTHYPILESVIQRTLPDCTLVDSAHAVAAAIKQHLVESEQLRKGRFGDLKLFATDTGDRFLNIGRRFLDDPHAQLEHVDL